MNLGRTGGTATARQAHVTTTINPVVSKLSSMEGSQEFRGEISVTIDFCTNYSLETDQVCCNRFQSTSAVLKTNYAVTEILTWFLELDNGGNNGYNAMNRFLN
jgi:hypothetical protein